MPQTAYLDRVSADLSRSLHRCHLLVDDYRSHLRPANSNEPEFLLARDRGKDEQEG
jgi:hypothetical protein